ncbi:hypothetical protein ACJIZ3_024029 [Penstemon smallii]|uniref:Amidase domain-containing protein n=1 Tax=Penstemon smallii TaxID=265156 RepID=A0ABD3TSN1_9LAMI
MKAKGYFGAFIERLELLPSPKHRPPARRPLSGLTFAINDSIDVQGYVTGYGSSDWKRTHVAAGKTARVVTKMLRGGATCAGKTVMDELGFGILGENTNYGTPTNPIKPSHIPGGSSSGSAVAVAAKLIDFALGSDTIGDIRVPASFCGILGFRPSHGVISAIGVLPNSESLDTVGCLASDLSVLHRLGHVLLQLNPLDPKRRRIIIADDVFQLSKFPVLKTVHIVRKVTEKLSGYQTPKHMKFGQYIASKVPSLNMFYDDLTNQQSGIFTLKALSSAMLLLQRYEFKRNHEEWIKSVKPKLGPHVSSRVWEAIYTVQENVESLYKVRMEMRAALESLLKDDGILVIPTVADGPLELNSRGLPAESGDRMHALLSIANMSGVCQVAIPLGQHEEAPISVSFIASHRANKFLLDTVLDMYSSLQEEVNIVSASSPLPDTDDEDRISNLPINLSVNQSSEKTNFVNFVEKIFFHTKNLKSFSLTYHGELEIKADCTIMCHRNDLGTKRSKSKNSSCLGQGSADQVDPVNSVVLISSLSLHVYCVCPRRFTT